MEQTIPVFVQNLQFVCEVWNSFIFSSRYTCFCCKRNLFLFLSFPPMTLFGSINTHIMQLTKELCTNRVNSVCVLGKIYLKSETYYYQRKLTGTSAIKWWSILNVLVSPSVFYSPLLIYWILRVRVPLMPMRVQVCGSERLGCNTIHPEVNLTNPGLDTQKSKTGVPVVPQNGLIFYKRVLPRETARDILHLHSYPAGYPIPGWGIPHLWPGGYPILTWSDGGILSLPGGTHPYQGVPHP